MPVALLIARIERSDDFVDVQGHRAADALLTAVADSARSVFNAPGQIVAQYRAADIAVFLPEVDRRQAATCARDLRDRVAGLGQAHPRSTSGQVAVSVGVAVADADAKRRLGLQGLATVAYEALGNAGELESGGISVL